MKFRLMIVFFFLGTTVPGVSVDLVPQNQSLSSGPWAGFWNPAALNLTSYSGVSAYFPDLFQEGELGLTFPGIYTGLWGVGPQTLRGFRIGLGTPSFQGFSLGGRFTGGERTTGEAYLSFRPWPVLSCLVSSQVTSPEGVMSVALRPWAMVNTAKADILSLEADASYSAGQFTWTRLGGSSELVPGLLIQAGWRPSDWGLTLAAHWRWSGTELWGAYKPEGKGWSGGAALGSDPRPQWQEPGGTLLVWNGPGQICVSSAGRGMSLYQFVRLIQIWTHDPRVGALAFPEALLPESQAVAEEMEEALKGFRAAGKFLWVRSGGMGLAQYRVFAQADVLSMHPTALLDLKGFQYSQVYWKDFFQDWGIEVVNFRSHDTKTAGNAFSEKGMTDAEKNAWGTALDEWNALTASVLAQGRGGRLKFSGSEIFTQGPYWNMAKALEAGLIDRLEFDDEWQTALERKFPLRCWTQDYAQKSPAPEVTAINRRIVVLYARGDILDGEGISGRNIGSDSYVQALRQLRNDPRVAAVVLRIDSGGGGIRASQSIAREVALFRGAKPLYVSMGNFAASGGYYIAAPAQKIFADQMTLTGSIGVLALIPQISGLLEKLHLHYQAVKTGPQADFPSLFRPLSGQERELVTDMVAADYRMFVNFVAQNRKLSYEAVDAAAQGRVWSSAQAQKKGLVDQMGGLTQTLQAVRQECGGGDWPVEEMAPGRQVWDLWGVFSNLTGVQLGGPVSGQLTSWAEAAERMDQLAGERVLAWTEDPERWN